MLLSIWGKLTIRNAKSSLHFSFKKPDLEVSIIFQSGAMVDGSGELGRLSSPILPYPSVTSTCYLWRHISQPWQLSITKLVLKSARGMNEQVLKTWGADVLSSRKKLRKTSWGSGIHPPPPLYVRGLISTRFCSLFWRISKRQRGKTQHVFRIWWHFPFPA